jgi:Helix-loop-helix DNA-binding domain
VQVRKTSHKAAEQKRRDSLKTTFDDLRILLPPIPLPSDENFPDERILPGALPPRGPPKAGGEGPNKSVSKLQLLMCGNDYIRQLKARVERRDEEIERLRREIMRLRVLVGDDAAANDVGEEMVDLERDLDVGEPFGAGFGRGGSVVGDDEADDDGEE